MGLRNTVNEYGSLAKGFHWLMFLIIVGMLYAGFYMHSLPPTPEKFTWYFWHKSTGIIALTLVLLRLTWKWANPRPLLPENLAHWQVLAAIAVHTLLYVLMVFMPLTGWLMSSAANVPVTVYGWFELPHLIEPNKAFVRIFKIAHELGALSFVAFITMHIGAALLHHFYYKDTVLKRMLPWHKE